MKVGRPSRYIIKRITIGLDEDMYSKLTFLANREGISISEYVRKILRKNTK